jgi:16S rRNA (cytosine967-C5)-methyltransferase
MAASPARQVAFEVLRRVDSENAYASDLLHAKLGKGVSHADSALATELTLGAIRWQRLLDFLIQPALDRPIERLDDEVRIALRLGLYQLRFLDRIPVQAAVNESVELTKSARKRSAAALVNAVLRKLAPTAKLPLYVQKQLPGEISEADRLGILYSHPTWMVERWLARFGLDRAVKLLEANNSVPQTACAVFGPDRTAQIAEALRATGFEVEPGRWLKAALRISGANPAESPSLRSGEIAVQDEASQMVAHLVDARPGDLVLDVCSAPGGKTRILAQAVAPEGRVIAGDLHIHRLRAARQQLQRTGAEGVFWLALDATQSLPFSTQFDRILLDAPCSGTGTLARNPEIRWRLQLGDLIKAHEAQTSMLVQAMQQLQPGGRLVYATCSLEPEENEHTVRRALRQQPSFSMVSGESGLRPWLAEPKAAPELFDSDGFFRTFPPDQRTDGFFAAVLERAIS